MTGCKEKRREEEEEGRKKTKRYNIRGILGRIFQIKS